MTSLSKWAHVSIIISPHDGRWRLRNATKASLACWLRSPVGYITQKPSRYVSCSGGLNQICDDAFLAGHFCAFIQTALAPYSTVTLNMWLENRILWPSKQISLTLMNCVFVSASSRSYFPTLLPKVRLLQVDEDILFPHARYTPLSHVKLSVLTFTDGRKLKAGPLDSCYGRLPSQYKLDPISHCRIRFQTTGINITRIPARPWLVSLRYCNLLTEAYRESPTRILCNSAVCSQSALCLINVAEY